MKTEKGYCTTDGKYVKSVDGHNDLDELFQPSVSPEGELIYYPVLFQKYRNYKERRNKWQIPCQESLTVHYRDGNQQILTTEPYIPYTEKAGEEYKLYPEELSIHEVDGIPVIKLRHFSEYFLKCTWEKTFETYQDAPAIILDLRDNPGGDGIVPFLLFQAYLGEEVSFHYNCIDVWVNQSPMENPEEKFIENSERLFIFLTNTNSASAAEETVDLSRNIENAFIVGVNTSGCLSVNGNPLSLPNSMIHTSIGRNAFAFPDSANFEELRGFLPDLWVPFDQAEEAAVALIKNLTAHKAQ